jgi:DNA-binding SARP family transcriptional activator
MLHLKLFGRFSVNRCDCSMPSEAVVLSGRPGGLLAYLALAKGRFFTRSELIAALWSDQIGEISLGTFSTTLWRLRKVLERPPLEQTEIVVCDRRGAVGLSAQTQLRLDVDEFISMVKPGLSKPMEQLDESDVENMRNGVSLYSDDILAGFSDDWALRERESYRRMLLNALARLMQLSVLAQDPGGAIRYAQEILNRDPLREDIHRELMRLFLVSGQRAMALRQFEQCRALLRKELAIQPMRETIALYQQIADDAVGRRNYDHDEPALPVMRRDIPVRADSGFGKHELPGPTASELISNARRYLSLADAHLQQSLPLFENIPLHRP